MRWIWDNIDLKRDESSRFIFLVLIFLLLLAIKVYLMVFYKPSAVTVDASVFDQIEMAVAEKRNQRDLSNPTKTKNPYSPSSSKSKSYKKSKPIAKEALANKNTPLKLLETFYFNPNTLSKDSLLALGLSRHAVNSLLKYRSKGGTIRSPEQMEKINGMDEETLQRIMPYVTLPKPKQYSTPKANTKPYKKYTKKTPSIIDINLADTTAFKSLYGIGRAYSRMIVRYRDKLGGFISVDQIGQTRGLPDSTYQKILPFLKLDPANFSKKNINDLDYDALNSLPFVSWTEAKAITAYKKTHGDFTNIEDLHKLYGLKESKVDTLKMYFDVK